ncbi:DUF551 domain-containing protein [Escherichia coli]|nr:DUF551 domain-containing protein [Escherichia coli]EFA4099508.1 DUF551 domain-containing protein [Escherichia coli]EFM6099642.1 DUF551 domain-containing protein [Escherichia coli]EJA4743163.1 DUF551 domain-containing protein [Escherichia coli]
MTLTKEWLLKTIAELEEERAAVPGAVNEDAARPLAAMKLALTSLEAEPVAYMVGTQLLENMTQAIAYKADTALQIKPLYTATSAPVSVPDLKPVGFLFVSDDGAVAYSPAGWPMKGFNLIGPIYGDVNAYRAAMLQAEPVSNSDELPLDYLQGHKDGLEWAAQLAEANHPQTGDWLYDDPIDLARAIRKGPDMPTVQGGNSPVTPDAWISCSERMPNDKQYVWCWGKSYGWTECDTFEGYYDWSRNKWWAVTDDGEEPASKVNHWMPLPEPPQEVK